MTTRLLLEYDGSRFAGWAQQPGLRTVQEEVERALAVLLRPGEGGVSVTVAGRTDTGVHAWGQVCSYHGEPVSVKSLNALLPGDIAALECSRAADGFDARRDATSRAYCYRVLGRRGRSVFWAGRALHWPHPIDFSALSECAAALVGTPDFTAFTPTQTEHIRFSREVFSAFWRRAEGGDDGSWPSRHTGDEVGLGTGGEMRGRDAGVGRGGEMRTGRGTGADMRTGRGAGGDTRTGRGAGGDTRGLLEFWIEGDSFMRHMNRVLVGTMLEVAGGRRTVNSFVELLSGRPREDAGPTAPAHGLHLVGVGYEGERVL